MPFTEAVLNGALDSMTPNRARLHSGDPGVAGTANQLGSLTTVTFDAASGAERDLNADVTFTGLGANASVTHVSLWNSTGPTFLGGFAISSGDTTANAAGEYILKATSKLTAT